VGVDGRIHPTLEQVWARTGRLTSKNPNGQNLFPIIKECFIPTNDYIGQIDLSQVEWRAAGELADDTMIINEVNSGIDQHVATLRELMELPFISKADPQSKQNRNYAKVFNFRMIFGGTEWGFHLDIHMPKFGVKKWRVVIDKFWKKYFRLNNFHNNNIRHVIENGEVTTLTGRRYVFDKCIEEEGDWVYSYNQIKNRLIQGTAAELLALLGVVIRRGIIKKKCKTKMILTVHDSIVFDIKKGEEDYIKWLCLATAGSLREYIKAYWSVDWRVKLEGEFEIGPNYKHQTEVKIDQKCEEVL
jgi:DNA polymerase-1